MLSAARAIGCRPRGNAPAGACGGRPQRRAPLAALARAPRCALRGGRGVRHAWPDGAEGAQPVIAADGQTLWLQADGQRPTLFGDSGFMLLPPAEQQAGLAPPRRRGGAGHALAPVPWLGAAAAGAAPLVVVPADAPMGIIPFNGEPVVLRGSGYVEAVAVEAEVLPPEGAHAPPVTALAPRPAAAPGGIVPHPSLGGGGEGACGGEEGVYESFSSSPRRGHKIRFTCKRCSAVSIRPINIHAWREGTVFARCGRCGVTHKLVDNLQLFHEMAGPVFPPPGPPLPPGAPLPPGLQLRLEELGGAGPAAPGAHPPVGGWPGFSARFPPDAGGDGERGAA